MNIWGRGLFGLLAFGIGIGGACAMNDATSTKTICVGRLALDIPSTATIRMDALYHGIQVDNKGSVTHFSQIKQAVEASKEKYHSVVTDHDAGEVAFLKAAGLDPAKALSPTQLAGTTINVAKQQTVIAYHTQPDSLDVTVELHALIEGHEWVFTLTKTSAGDFASDSATLANAANRFKPIQKQTTTLPGFCVMGGVFTDAGKPEIGENMTLAINDPAHQDMDLTIEGNDFSRRPSESSSEDMDRDLATLKQHIHDLKVLDRGSRTVAGQDGYLIAVTGTDPDLGGARFFKYFWTASGTPNDVMKPSLNVELLTHANNVSEETFKDADEVSSYFDRILEGMRVRP